MSTLTKQAKQTLDTRLGSDLKLPLENSFEPVIKIIKS